MLMFQRTGVLRLESHLEWIIKLVNHLETTTKIRQEDYTIVDYVKWLLKAEANNGVIEGGELKFGRKHITEEDADEEDLTSDGCHTPFGYVALKLNLVTFYALTRDMELARHHLMIVQKKLNEEKEFDGGHLMALTYAVDALDWVLKVFERYRLETEEASSSKEDDDDSSLQLGDSASSFKQPWSYYLEEEVPSEFVVQRDLLQNKFKKLMGNHQAEATIHFLQGCLGAALKIKEKEVLNFYQKALELDPTFHVWFHFAYRKLRRIRRQYRKSGRLAAPGACEKLYCEKAYELCPSDVMNVLDYAFLVKDMLWNKPKQVWYEEEENIRKCIALFKDALEIVNENESLKNRNKWIRKVKVGLGEFLLFGKDEGLSQERGKEFIEECLKDFPNSTFVLHKAAKMHHRGAAFTQNFKDHMKAREYYCRALQYPNFPALMDYLKLLQENHRYFEMMEIINKFLLQDKVIQRDAWNAKLFIERGCIVWLFNPLNTPIRREEACRNWVQVVMVYPEYIDEICHTINRQNLFDNDDPSAVLIKTSLVIETLEDMKEDYENEKEIDAILKLIQALKDSTDKRKSRSGGGRKGGRSEHENKPKNQQQDLPSQHEKEGKREMEKKKEPNNDEKALADSLNNLKLSPITNKTEMEVKTDSDLTQVEQLLGLQVPEKNELKFNRPLLGFGRGRFIKNLTPL